MIAKLNSKKFFFSSTLALGAIAGVGIAATPAQAADFTQISSLQWTGDTSDFVQDAADAIVNETAFTVTFDVSGESSVRGASGDFVQYFPGLPDDFVTNSPTVDFNFFMAIDTPPGFADAAEFELQDPLTFSFQTPAGPGSPVELTLPAGSIFTAVLDLDDGVEVELDPGQLGLGEWEALLPNAPGGDPDISGTANSSTFTFDQSAASIIGVYSATGDFSPNGVPEPASILGLIAVGGLGMAMKRKKQS